MSSGLRARRDLQRQSRRAGQRRAQRVGSGTLRPPFALWSPSGAVSTRRARRSGRATCPRAIFSHHTQVRATCHTRQPRTGVY
eukprot:6978193-Prymnesium_polylepis.1